MAPRLARLGMTLGICLLAAEIYGQDVPFDAVVEQADRWRVESADRVTVAVDSEHTHGTPRALHLAWKTDLGDIAGKGIPTTPQVPRCWLELPADLDLSGFTRFTFWAKITGTRHGHLHVAFGNKPLLWGQDLKRHINNSPLDAGEWSQYQVTLGHIDAEERKTYRWMGIASINVGYQPDESPVMHVWLDDFVWASKPMRKFRGWDADPTVVIVSQAGFCRFHEKLAVVDGQSKAEAFVVRDVATAKEAFRGPLKPLSSAVGRYKVADFTRFNRPGRYTVEAGDLKSLPFTIGDDAFKPCVALLSDWVFNMRCGCKTALHEPCHLDDGTFVEYEGEAKDRKEVSRRCLDLVGGWHDAGDVRTYYNYSYWMAHQSLRARECGWRRDRDSDGVDDLLDDALWAMRHVPKLRNPLDGSLFFKIEDWPDYRRGNYWTDNKIGTPDDRHVMQPPEILEYVGFACASAGLFARTAGKDYPAMAEAALKVAESRYTGWLDPETGKIPWRQKPIMVDHGHGYNVAKLGRGSLQLFLATKKPLYLDFARYCGDTIMGYQKRAFYPGGARPRGGESYTAPGARLLRALIAVSEPARVRLTLRNDGQPWRGQVSVKWPVTGETVFTGKSDAHGALPEMQLDGGQTYELVCGQVTLPLVVVSGTRYERTLDFARVLVLSAKSPQRVKPGQTFAVELSVHNRGLKTAKAAITVHAEDSTPDQPSRPLDAAPGQTATIPWPFKAGEAHRPYVLCFTSDGDRATGLDVTGAILP